MSVSGLQGIQLPLALGRIESHSFGHYLPGPNVEAYRCLLEVCKTARPACLYLWGASGIGKTHLLQADCQNVSEHQKQAAYLPLSQIDQLSPAMFDGLEALDLICLDDLDFIAGKCQWEHALFHLYNQVNDCGKSIVATARTSPQGLGLTLADLESRLSWGLVFHLKDLDDETKLMVLRRKADARGFELPIKVADYLLKRYPRDMGALCRLLDQLDQASLAAQRKLTIPFVRRALLDGY